MAGGVLAVWPVKFEAQFFENCGNQIETPRCNLFPVRVSGASISIFPIGMFLEEEVATHLYKKSADCGNYLKHQQLVRGRQ